MATPTMARPFCCCLPSARRCISTTSAGAGVRVAWEDVWSADLSVAKAVNGPRDDWRAFVILGAKY